MTWLNSFVAGALVMATLAAGLFFLRFWRDTRDRLFAFFAAAFWMLSLEWTALATMAPGRNTRHYFYLVRLLAFVLILIGIADKNRGDK